MFFESPLQSTASDCKITPASGEKTFYKSPTKTRQPRKVDLRARYWAFLFDNLRRAVDEIYVTCESDQSVVECKVRLSGLVHGGGGDGYLSIMDGLWMPGEMDV